MQLSLALHLTTLKTSPINPNSSPVDSFGFSMYTFQCNIWMHWIQYLNNFYLLSDFLSCIPDSIFQSNIQELHFWPISVRLRTSEEPASSLPTHLQPRLHIQTAYRAVSVLLKWSVYDIMFPCLSFVLKTTVFFDFLSPTPAARI